MAASGSPLAMALASVTTSGTMPGLLERPHRAGPAVARLDLVGDEQDAVLVGQLAQPLQERRRRGREAALALHRLDQERGHRLRRDLRREEVLEEADRRRRRGRLVAAEPAVRVGNGAMWMSGSSGPWPTR